MSVMRKKEDRMGQIPALSLSFHQITVGHPVTFDLCT